MTKPPFLLLGGNRVHPEGPKIASPHNGYRFIWCVGLVMQAHSWWGKVRGDEKTAKTREKSHFPPVPQAA